MLTKTPLMSDKEETLRSIKNLSENVAKIKNNQNIYNFLKNVVE